MITQIQIVLNVFYRLNQDRRLREKAVRKKEKESQQEKPSDHETKNQLNMLQNDISHLTQMVKDLLALNEGKKYIDLHTCLAVF